MVGGATVALGVLGSLDRHVVRGESMKPTLAPRDTVISIRRTSVLGRLRPPRVGDIVVLRLPWEHDLVVVKRLVAGPGDPWDHADGTVAPGPGWVAVGDEPVLSTDSRHHGRVGTEHLSGVVVARVGPPERSGFGRTSSARSAHARAGIRAPGRHAADR